MAGRINTFAPTKPHEKQKEVLAALDQNERYVLLRAGRKWRKTSLMISWLFEKAIDTHLTCPYVAPSRVQAKNIAWDDHVRRLLTEFRKQRVPYKVNKQELSITLPKGGKVQLLGVENEEGLRGISNWGAFAGDEYDDWEEDIFPTIIRPNLLPHKAQAILGGTPKGFRNIYRLDMGGLFKSFHFTSHDNSELDPKELEELEKEYRDWGEDYYRQEIMAEYVKPVGVVYKEWNLDTQYKEFDYHPNIPVHVSIDYGVNDPTAIGWFQKLPTETRMIDYYEKKNADIAHHAQVINSKPYTTPELITGDPYSGDARSITTNTTPNEEFAKHGIHIRAPEKLDIPNQIRVAHKYAKTLYVKKGLERFRDCILNYRYPTKKTALVDQSNEKPIHDEYSHGMRMFEYYCLSIDKGFVGRQDDDLIIGEIPREEWRDKSFF